MYLKNIKSLGHGSYIGQGKHVASTCKSVDTSNEKHTSHICKALLRVSREVLNVDVMLCAFQPSLLHAVLHTVAEVDQ